MVVRSYKFKGKSVDTNEWIIGSLLTNSLIVEKINEDGTIVVTEVIPETVCQLTGLIDTYGTPIYENDIVEYFKYKSGKVCYINHTLNIEGFHHADYYNPDRAFSDPRTLENLKVIGNYYDNNSWEVK